MRDERPTPAPAVGALRQWRREIEAGVRKSSDADALWLSACWEARAEDAIRLHDASGASRDRAKAAEILAAFVEGAA